jgi:hypothetical protein
VKLDWSALRSRNGLIAVGGLVLITTLVSGHDGAPDADVVAAVDRSAAPAGRAEAPPQDLDLQALDRRRKETVIGNNIFATPGGDAAAPAPGGSAPAGAPAAPPPPAEPEAPPLPFRYMGQIIDGGRKLVFLARDNDQYSAAVGQVIGDQYRVEEIARNEITLTYLPAGIRQSLAIPALD